MTGSGTTQGRGNEGGQGGRRSAGLIQATWLLATAIARQIAARIDDRLARRLQSGAGRDR